MHEVLRIKRSCGDDWVQLLHDLTMVSYDVLIWVQLDAGEIRC
jgi:hypothetical protein